MIRNARHTQFRAPAFVVVTVLAGLALILLGGCIIVFPDLFILALVRVLGLLVMVAGFAVAGLAFGLRRNLHFRQVEFFRLDGTRGEPHE